MHIFPRDPSRSACQGFLASRSLPGSAAPPAAQPRPRRYRPPRLRLLLAGPGAGAGAAARRGEARRRSSAGCTLPQRSSPRVDNRAGAKAGLLFQICSPVNAGGFVWKRPVASGRSGAQNGRPRLRSTSPATGRRISHICCNLKLDTNFLYKHFGFVFTCTY